MSEYDRDSRSDVGMGYCVCPDRRIPGRISREVVVFDYRVIGLSGADEQYLSVHELNDKCHADSLRHDIVGSELEYAFLRARAIKERALALEGWFTGKGHRLKILAEHSICSSADGGEHQMRRERGAWHGMDAAYAGKGLGYHSVRFVSFVCFVSFVNFGTSSQRDLTFFNVISGGFLSHAVVHLSDSLPVLRSRFDAVAVKESVYHLGDLDIV